MKRTTQRLATLAAVGTIALAGCAGQGSGDSGSSATPTQSDLAESGGEGESAPSATAGSEQDDAEGSGSSGQDASSKKTSGSSMKNPAGTHIARTAALTLTVEDVERASAKVRSAASGAGGYISSEETRLADDEDGGAQAPRSSSSASGDHEPPSRAGSWAEIVVTVPVDELDSTMTELAEVGTVTQRTSDAEDLTQQYTDTTARVRTMKKSIERLRSLIDDTDDLEQIVTLEDELSEREADLESMVSQQKSLEKRTTTAPITVSLATPGTADDEAEETEETGFLAGLDQGWSGFTSALTAGLTVLGAVTPFALTALVLLAPVVWWLRRRPRRAVAGPADAG